MNQTSLCFFDWWRDHSSEFEAVLFDVDGTLISGSQLLPGADAMIAWLRKNNFPFYLLTNDGNHSLEEKSGLLSLAGLQIAPDEIVSCSSALESYVEKNNLHGGLAFVMGDLGNPDYAEHAGLKVTRNVDEIDDCACVIVGEGSYDWRKNINAAINTIIRYPGRPVIVPNPDSYWPNGPSGEIGIGAGGKARFMKSILSEMGIDLEITYLGKPYPSIFEYTFSLLKKRFGLPGDMPKEKLIMFGDNLRSDILGANNAGYTSILMLTGVTGIEQAEKAEGGLKPDFIFESL